MFSNLLGIVPLPYRILAGVVLAIAIFAGGFASGARVTGDHWQAKVADSERRAAAIEQKQATATVQVVTRYVDRVQTVRAAGKTIIKEVPVYVTKDADAGCVIPRGFARLHDAASANQIPGPAGSADAAPAGIELSTVAATVIDNYERCHENSTTLTGLQEWVLAQQSAGQ